MNTQTWDFPFQQPAGGTFEGAGLAELLETLASVVRGAPAGDDLGQVRNFGQP